MLLWNTPLLALAVVSPLEQFRRALADETFVGIHRLSWFDWSLLIPYFILLAILAVYGTYRYEVIRLYYRHRHKLPKEPGHWPAFWLMCDGVRMVGDDGRDGTEIDIIEVPWRDGRLTINLHWDGYGKDHKSAGSETTIPALTEGFHDYGLLWLPEEYVFYVDGKAVWRSKAGGVCQVPEYLKLTEEIGKWGGDIGQAQLPDFFEVDYVRVYDLAQK